MHFKPALKGVKPNHAHYQRKSLDGNLGLAFMEIGVLKSKFEQCLSA